MSLELARSPSFQDAEQLYSGTNQAYFLSGLEGGDYFLRLTGPSGEQSRPIELNVEHQSLAQALWLSAIGAIIALGIVVTILRGARP